MREHILTGDAREYLVMADLTKKGFEVGRMSGKASFDIAVYKDSKLYRVEVKGETDGPRSSGPVGSLSPKGNLRANEFDIVATVYNNGSIKYNRSLFCASTTTTLELTLDDTPSKKTRKDILARAACVAAVAKCDAAVKEGR